MGKFFVVPFYCFWSENRKLLASLEQTKQKLQTSWCFKTHWWWRRKTWAWLEHAPSGPAPDRSFILGFEATKNRGRVSTLASKKQWWAFLWEVFRHSTNKVCNDDLLRLFWKRDIIYEIYASRAFLIRPFHMLFSLKQSAPLPLVSVWGVNVLTASLISLYQGLRSKYYANKSNHFN